MAPTAMATPTANLVRETFPATFQITAKSGGQSDEIRQGPEIPEPVLLHYSNRLNSSSSNQSRTFEDPDNVFKSWQTPNVEHLWLPLLLETFQSEPFQTVRPTHNLWIPLLLKTF